MDVLDFSRDEKSLVSFGIRLDRREWEPYLKSASSALQRQTPLRGFRPGAAPLKTAEAMYGKALYQAAANEAQGKLLPEICSERQLEPVSVPEIMVVTADKSGFECVCRFFNYPEIRELNYRGLTAKKPHRAVTEADIDREAENFRRNHLKVYETDREARLGDIAEVSFRGTCDGHGFPFDHSDKSRFILGSGRLFAGLDGALLGHHGGDELELSLTMPKTFHRQEIAGLTLDLSVRLKGVWARELQEMNDAFVRETVKDCETVSAYREKLRGRLQQVYEARSDEIFRRNLEASLAEAVSVPLPESMVRTNYERYLAGLFTAAKAQGKTPEELLQTEGKTMVSYQEEILPLAQRQVLYSLAVEYIVQKEALTVSEQELDVWSRESAEAMGLTPEKLLEQSGGREAIVQELLTRKVMALVAAYAHAEIVETDRLPGEDPDRPVLMN